MKKANFTICHHVNYVLLQYKNKARGVYLQPKTCVNVV